MNMEEAFPEFFADQDARDARSRSREAREGSRKPRARSRSPDQESNNLITQ